METIDPATSDAPSSSAPSTSATSGVTLEAIMVRLQWMEANFGGRLDYLTDEMCQMNTRVSRIAHKQARMAGHTPSSPSPQTSPGDDGEDGATSSGDDEMTTSQ